MSKFRISLLAMATLALAGALTVGGVALAQSQGTPSPTNPAQTSATPWIGVSLVDLNEKVAARVGVSETTGVVIAQVVGKSPAAEAGLQVGDIVTSVDTKTVAKADEVVAAVKAKKVGEQVAFTVSRKGSSLLVTVTTAEAPQAPQRGKAPGANPPNLRNLPSLPNLPGRGLGDFGFGPGLSGRGGFGLGGLLDGLKGLSPSELFGHIMGGQFRFTDKDGNAVTVKSIPGTVVNAAKDSITIKPNDKAETGTTFAINADTKVQLPGRAAVESLKPGDQVIVVTSDGKTALTVKQGAAGSLIGNSGNLQDKLNGLRNGLQNRLPKQAPSRVTPAPSGTSS